MFKFDCWFFFVVLVGMFFLFVFLRLVMVDGYVDMLCVVIVGEMGDLDFF